ncbi:thiamine phosphate synthase, partial [Candidatus Calescamantes bacterium]|nr:thiamine phosphate synthase [Candidatus Calescamantes bacterium]
KIVEGILVAIGGITLYTLSEVKSTGVDGVAVISGILEGGDIERKAREWVKAWEECRF